MSDNLRIYHSVCAVPKEALRPISGGRLKGKSDINPMWRIKKLTELFGPCGIGWKSEIVKFWTEPGVGGEVTAFVHINLYIKDGDSWSEPIPGIGGNLLIEKESKGLHTNDECYKMAYTDALSVACKALGVAGDVYWQNDPTKYSERENSSTKTRDSSEPPRCISCFSPFESVTHNGKLLSPDEHMQLAKKARGSAICKACHAKQKEQAK